MRIWKKYSEEISDEKFDAIVIGSGMGGLTTAALLSKAGKRVLVLERHFKVGGFTHTFKRSNYEWDVGIHYIGGVQRENLVLRRLFDYVTDGNLHWHHMEDVYDRIIFPDKSYDLVAGKNNFFQKLCGYFPEEENAITQYLKLVRESVKSGMAFFGNRALPSALSAVTYPFMSRKYLKLSNQTTMEVLSNLTGNRKLIGVLTGQFGDYGLPPSQSSFAMHASVVHHYLNGGSYPVGGARSIAETIAPVINQSGGVILVSTPVEEILTPGNKATGVRLSNGDELTAPLIISNAGVHTTFNHLIKNSTFSNRKVNKITPSCSHICLYIGLKHTAKELGLSTTNLWIYPDYDHDKNIENYNSDPSAPLPVTYVSFPSSKDPEWDKNHPGTATMEAIGFAPYEWFEKWKDTQWKKRDDEYESFKEKLTHRLMENVYKHVPQIEGKVDYLELSTPLTTKEFTGYNKGEIYGIDHTPQRFRERWLKPKTPIKNLYLTGQDIVTVGLASALIAGFLTTSVILKKNIMKDILND